MDNHHMQNASKDHWDWRLQMARLIASRLDSRRFGVEAIYIIGSTKNATAGPASDIDLLVHFRGTEIQREQLSLWFEGWSLGLDEANFIRTGLRTGGLLDVHFVTDDDIVKKSSYAVKIDSPTDPAQPLPLKSLLTSKESTGGQPPPDPQDRTE